MTEGFSKRKKIIGGGLELQKGKNTQNNAMGKSKVKCSRLFSL